MAMWPDDPDPVDAAIDEVARQMTDGMPGANFRTRVLARIGEPRAAWRSPWILAPLALAAVVLVAAMVHRGRPADQHDLRSAEQPGQAGALIRLKPDTTNADTTGADIPTRGTTAETGRPHTTAVPPRPQVRRTFVPSPGPASDIDALAPAALDVGSIALDRLARPEPIVIQRLETTPITLAPIGEGDRP
jgi:hypothetical protein